MTNKEVLDINQKAWASKPVTNLPAGFENVRVWEASEEAIADTPEFVALFNLDDKPVTLHFTWKQICQMCATNGARNLHDASKWKGSEPVELKLPAHGSAIFGSLSKTTGHAK
jgi:hypothetical protein